MIPLNSFQPSMFPMNSFIPQFYEPPTFKFNSKRSAKKKIRKKGKKVKKEKESKDKKQSITVLEYQPGKNFNGIIDYLTKQTGGNAHVNHTIEIKVNSTRPDSFRQQQQLKFIVDYHLQNNYYQSSPTGNTTITFDFKEKRVNITRYSIRSMNTFNCSSQ